MGPYSALAKMTRARATVLIPTAIMALFIAALVNTMVMVLVTPGMNPMLVTAIGQAGEVTLIPFVIGLSIVVGGSIPPRLDQFSSLRCLGVPRGQIKRYLLMEAILITAVAAVLGALAAPAVLFLLVITVYADFAIPYPEGLTPSLVGGLVSLVVLVLLAVIATLVAGRSLGERPHRSEQPRLWTRGRVALVIVSLGFSLLAGGICLALIGGAAPIGVQGVFPFLAWMPLWAALASGGVLILAAWAAGHLAVRVLGWDWIGVAMRQIRLRPAAGVACFTVLLMAYPLALYAGADVLTEQSKQRAAAAFADVPIVVHSDGSLLSVAEADDICAGLGAACRGRLQWQVGFDPGDGTIQAAGTETNGLIYVLSATPATVMSDVLTTTDPAPLQGAFDADLLPAWRGVVDRPLPDVYGTLLEVDPGTTATGLPAGVHVIGAHSWASTQMPSRLVFGPTGTGLKGLFALFIYLVLGCMALIFGVTTIRQMRLHTLTDSLSAIGLSRAKGSALRAVVNIAAAALAVVLSLVTCLAVSTTMVSSLRESLTLALPGLPVGLTVSLILLVVAAALSPTWLPVQRPRA